MNAQAIARKNLDNAKRRSLSDQFKRDFAVVMDHYRVPKAECEEALKLARADFAGARACYRAIAKSLEPERKIEFSVRADQMVLMTDERKKREAKQFPWLTKEVA
jgi:hypothetical protein